MTPLSSLISASAALDSPAPTQQTKSPVGGLATMGAAALLHGLAATTAVDDYDEPCEEGEEGVQGVSRKDKSLGLLCDNFLQLFASGAASAVELEGVASTLGVGRRRIYDIVNVLESLDVVQKDRASSYTWLGITKLPECIDKLSRVRPVVPLLLDDTSNLVATAAFGGDDETAFGDEGSGSGRNGGATGSGGGGASQAGRGDKQAGEGRKEKSIRELSTKFVGLFLQSTGVPSLDGTISLEQAARSLLKHEAGLGPEGPEPDQGAMKTKVRRLYDICNVLTSLRMIVKVRLPDTSKPAFKWLGVTDETESVFDSTAAAARPVKAYGGGINAPVCAKRGRSSFGSDGNKGARPAHHGRAAPLASLGVGEASPAPAHPPPRLRRRERRRTRGRCSLAASLRAPSRPPSAPPPSSPPT